MKLTGLLSDSCPNGISCPRVHDTDGDEVLVQGTTVTDAGVLAELPGELPDHESVVAVPRSLLYPEPMDVEEMVDWIFSRHTHDLLRIENHRWYSVESDGDDVERYHRGEPADAAAKAPWLRTLDEHTARGRLWRRVHVLPVGEALTRYEEYEFGSGFVDNAAHGEVIRILEAPIGQLDGVPDFFVIDGVHVVRSLYDEAGRHLGGQVIDGVDAAVYRALAAGVWSSAEPFTDWWPRHPQYHRAAAA